MTDNWTAGGIVSWTTGSDWSTGSPPSSGQDAFVGTGPGGIVTVNTSETVDSIGVSSDYAVVISGGTLKATLGTGAQTLTGHIDIEDGSAFEVDGNIVNSGTIELVSEGADTNLFFAADSFVTLSGGGDIEMDSQYPLGNFLAGMAGSEVINEDNDISGGGLIFGEFFTNDGIIETNNNDFGAGTLYIYGSGAGGGSFDNEGSMFVDPGGTLRLGAFTSQIANDGTIEFLGTSSNAATMQIVGNLTVVSVGGYIEMAGPDADNDSISSFGGAATLTLDGGTLKGAGSVGDANLTINLDPGTLVDATGSALVFNTGNNTISVADGAEMEATSGGTLVIESKLDNTGTLTANGGTVAIDAAVVDSGGVVTVAAGGALDLLSFGSIAGVASFTGVGAKIYLAGSIGQITGGITGGVFGDSVDLGFQTFSAGDKSVWQQGGGDSGTLLLENSGGTVLQSFTLEGQYSSGGFAAVSDGSGGTLIELANPNPPAATTADMIMRDGSNGDYEIYDLGNNAIQAAYALSQSATTWQVAGIGGFNGTDTSDMILRNSSTGAFEVYDVSNNNVTDAAIPMGQVGSAWAVSGFGDFSGNPGETDMLMQNTSSGDFEVYDISNNAITNAMPMGQVGTAWVVAGFGDFSGHAGETGDMLMRNSSTGAFEVYDITNNQITFAGSMGQVGLEWQVAGFGDFSGNANETDMLMRNTSTGAFEIYDISNNSIYNYASMGQVGLEWQVVGFGPIDGAGASDMLMRDTGTGAFELYDIGNNQITNAVSMGQVGTEWSVAGIAADPPGAAPANAQLAQAMASMGTGTTAPVSGGNSAQIGAETSAQTLLTTPQPG
jgi:hypothetical protein